ncbi:MAG TPA: DUF4390 domain-containing protein [Burkholderiaceae bacterium]
MTRRIFEIIRGGLLAALLLALTFAQAPALAAEGIEIVQAHLEASPEGYRLSATFAFELNPTLEDAINHGIPLHFTTQVEIKRPRWYWFDESTIQAENAVILSKNLLTNEYQANVIGGVQRSFHTLEEALEMMRHPSRWIVADRGALKSGTTYHVTMQMQLDINSLSMPIRFDRLNNSDWRFATDKKSFSFKAD